MGRGNARALRRNARRRNLHRSLPRAPVDHPRDIERAVVTDEQHIELVIVDLMRRRDGSARGRTEMIDERDQIGVVEVFQAAGRDHVAEIHERRVVVDGVRAEIPTETAKVASEVDMRQAVGIVVAGKLGEAMCAAVNARRLLTLVEYRLAAELLEARTVKWGACAHRFNERDA
jgi:hypothetical protein